MKQFIYSTVIHSERKNIAEKKNTMIAPVHCSISTNAENFFKCEPLPASNLLKLSRIGPVGAKLQFDDI